MSLKDATRCLHDVDEKIEQARSMVNHLHDGQVADVLSVLTSAVNEMSNAVTEILSELEDQQKDKVCPNENGAIPPVTLRAEAVNPEPGPPIC